MVDLGSGEAGRTSSDHRTRQSRDQKSWLIAAVAILALVGSSAHAEPGAYASEVRRLLLGAGASMSVTWQAKPGSENLLKTPVRLYPKLLIFGYLGDAFVFQVITKADLLSGAKAAGFNSVEFYSKGDQGQYLYDLTGPTPPPCDIRRRVCI